VNRIQTDVRKVLYNGTLKTSATSLPMVRTEGLNNVGMLYFYNPSTAAIYYNVRNCGINTATTSYWGTSIATATIATGTATCTTFSVLGNYVTIEFAATATGAGSAIIMLSVW
jgi:hypothetical protein